MMRGAKENYMSDTQFDPERALTQALEIPGAVPDLRNVAANLIGLASETDGARIRQAEVADVLRYRLAATSAHLTHVQRILREHGIEDTYAPSVAELRHRDRTSLSPEEVLGIVVGMDQTSPDPVPARAWETMVDVNSPVPANPPKLSLIDRMFGRKS